MRLKSSEPICPVDLEGMRARIRDFLANQDPDNPRMSTAGVGHIPKRPGRRMLTPQDVVGVADEASKLYGTVAEDVAEETNLPLVVLGVPDMVR